MHYTLWKMEVICIKHIIGGLYKVNGIWRRFTKQQQKRKRGKPENEREKKKKKKKKSNVNLKGQTEGGRLEDCWRRKGKIDTNRMNKTVYGCDTFYQSVLMIHEEFTSLSQDARVKQKHCSTFIILWETRKINCVPIL